MSSVGEVLKRARLEQALDLKTVAARTRIPIRYLAAIEADDRKSLPSGFFYRSFVDQYARLLSLDLKTIHTEVDLLLSQDAPLPLPGQENLVARNVKPMKAARSFHVGRTFASLAFLVGVVAGCSAIYTWWHGAMSSRTANTVATAVAPATSPAMAAAPSPTATFSPRAAAPSPLAAAPSPLLATPDAAS